MYIVEKIIKKLPPKPALKEPILVVETRQKLKDSKKTSGHHAITVGSFVFDEESLALLKEASAKSNDHKVVDQIENQNIITENGQEH